MKERRWQRMRNAVRRATGIDAVCGLAAVRCALGKAVFNGDIGCRYEVSSLTDRSGRLRELPVPEFLFRGLK